MTENDDDVWQELYDAIPRGWVVGRPPFDARARRWRLFGYRRRTASTGRIEHLEVEHESEDLAVRAMAVALRETAKRR